MNQGSHSPILWFNNLLEQLIELNEILTPRSLLCNKGYDGDKQPGEEIIEQGPEGSREQELRSQWS